MLWLLGLPSPALWGVVMFLAALIPYLGAWVVWIPAATLLIFQGNWGKAAILVAWGATAVGMIDNVLYPIFVGSRLRLHTLTAFMAFIGGLAVFGLSGLILGPVIVSVSLALMDIWRLRTSEGDPAEADIKKEMDEKEAREATNRGRREAQKESLKPA